MCLCQSSVKMKSGTYGKDHEPWRRESHSTDPSPRLRLIAGFVRGGAARSCAWTYSAYLCKASSETPRFLSHRSDEGMSIRGAPRSNYRGFKMSKRCRAFMIWTHSRLRPPDTFFGWGTGHSPGWWKGPIKYHLACSFRSKILHESARGFFSD